MTLSNIRLSSGNKIVLDHNYNERTAGKITRKVSKVKIMATPNEDGTYTMVNSSAKGQELAREFARKNNLTIIN